MAHTTRRQLAAASRTERFGEKRKQYRRERRLSFTVYGVALTTLGLLIPLLALVGVRTLLNSRDGEFVNPVLDPSQPRYQAMVPPSPTLLMLHLNMDNKVVGVALLTLPTFESPGGSVLLLPTLLAGDLPEVGEMPIEAAYAFSGLEAARSTTEWAFHLGIENAVAINDAEWSQLLAETGPLTIFNPDNLFYDDRSIAYPSGLIELEPTEVPLYAAHLDEGENHLNRLVRQELVWNAWLDELTANASILGDSDFGNEPTDILNLDSGNTTDNADPENQSALASLDTNDPDALLRRFLSQMSAGEHVVVQAPLIVDAVTPPDDPNAVQNVFRLDYEELARLIPSVIPFPAGYASNTRPLVRVLDGSGDQTRIPLVARLAIEAGGQVSMIGNAENFDYTATEIMYADSSWRTYAQMLQETLGFGTVVELEDMDENTDVMVLIGADARP